MVLALPPKTVGLRHNNHNQHQYQPVLDQPLTFLLGKNPPTMTRHPSSEIKADWAINTSLS